MIVKNKWDLSYLVDYIENNLEDTMNFNHHFDYKNDSQIIEFSGKFPNQFFATYIDHISDSVEFLDKNFKEQKSSNDLLIQIVVLTMLSSIVKK